MYCIRVKFYDAHRLFEAHPRIKSLSFIIGQYFDYVEDAHTAAVAYVNKYFAKLSEPIEWLQKVPVAPRNKAQWDKVPYGYYCTEQPMEWALDVWFKRMDKGLIWNAVKIEKLFSIHILQVYSEETACIDSSTVKWHYLPDAINDVETKPTRGCSVWDLSKMSNEVDKLR